MPPGPRALSAQDLTRAQIEQYVKQHPEKRPRSTTRIAVVKRQGKRPGWRVPYHEEYKQFLEPMAKALREAAALSDDRGLREVPAPARRRAALGRLLHERSGLARSEGSRSST